MKRNMLMGIIILAYGISSPAFSSDTATLTISGRVTAPTCSTDVINDQLQQRCGNASQQLSINHNTPASAKGVVTEIVTVANDDSRRIVLNRYD